mmetsp:Transcript_50041/g.102045  ORF Transcript_50041/g.102045 Transcript_50041/m.102045 type:complete len:292 (+) Transcript_50041:1389-2264(+)
MSNTAVPAAAVHTPVWGCAIAGGDAHVAILPPPAHPQQQAAVPAQAVRVLDAAAPWTAIADRILLLLPSCNNSSRFVLVRRVHSRRKLAVLFRALPWVSVDALAELKALVPCDVCRNPRSPPVDACAEGELRAAHFFVAHEARIQLARAICTRSSSALPQRHGSQARVETVGLSALNVLHPAPTAAWREADSLVHAPLSPGFACFHCTSSSQLGERLPRLIVNLDVALSATLTTCTAVCNVGSGLIGLRRGVESFHGQGAVYLAVNRTANLLGTVQPRSACSFPRPAHFHV